MADPFSIVVGTVGLVDVCWRVVTYLRDVKGAATKIEGQIVDLLHELDALISVNESIKGIFPKSSEAVADSDHVQTLWRNTGKVLQDCRMAMDKMEALVIEIVGKERPKGPGRFDIYKKQLRRQSKDEDFRQLRHQLSSYQNALQMLLTAINLTYTLSSQRATDHSLDQLSSTVQTLDLNLQSQIASLQPTVLSPDLYDLRSSVSSATAVMSLASPNQHFDIPQTVSSIFTGRKEFLEDVRNSFTAPSSPGQRQIQKRFVIYGLGGSGKTQFCCKYAQDNRQKFWGVFWIDASTDERVRYTFSRIAKIAGVEPNESAVKNWLSNLGDPWLLIIDSGDDPKMPIEKYFPGGERGHVLLTTRVPDFRVHGTVGPRFFHFDKLKDNDANELLLKAACEPSPWGSETRSSAAIITEALGFLPLALVHAGRAIMNHLCTLADYLTYYKGNFQRIRRARSASSRREDEKSNMNVYSSYEIIYLGLEAKGTEEAKDAIELLKLFSFFHCENIRVDILMKAATNPTTEREAQEKEQEKEKNINSASKSKTWAQTFGDIKFAILAFLLKDRSPPVLPDVLRDMEVAQFDNLRLRVALKELAQMSLITYNSGNDSYSMHPLVHTWVRERPDMSTAEQAVWCQAAATTLAQSILLPPLGGTEADEDLRRDLLPHVNHVQDCLVEIRERIIENQKRRRKPWPVIGPRFNRGQALRLAKFSRVYAQCGYWDEAERLQVKVKDFVCQMLGLEHPSATNIMLALSGTYWQLGRGNEAADLQARVLQICVKCLGENNHKTLKVMDTLGMSRWLQGRFTEALKLHETAMKGMTKLLGKDHEDTLKASDNLGRVHHKYFRYEEARGLHSTAVAGMQRVLGLAHLDTLSAMDNLAMTYLEIGGEYLNPAHELMLQVVEYRKRKLGKEHPYTLWAICNLARVKSALGHQDEAEHLMRAGLKIAERNLGENHIGTLFGRIYLGQVLVRQQHYDEAEETYIDVIERHKHMATATNAQHPDRISALLHLLECYKLQSKIGDALRTCDEISEALNAIGGQAHPVVKQLLDTRKELLDLQAVRRSSSVQLPAIS